MKLLNRKKLLRLEVQPPSGGCVLKRISFFVSYPPAGAAAFGRLCVETNSERLKKRVGVAAAFGRLCVETMSPVKSVIRMLQPPSGGCVLKLATSPAVVPIFGSRLRAAVC